MQVLLTGISAPRRASLTLFINPVWAIGVMALGQTVGNVVSSSTGLGLLRRRIGSLGLSSVVVTASRVGLAAGRRRSRRLGCHDRCSTRSSAPRSRARRRPSGGCSPARFEIGLVGLVFVVIYLGLAHALHVREVRDLSANGAPARRPLARVSVEARGGPRPLARTAWSVGRR